MGSKRHTSKKTVVRRVVLVAGFLYVLGSLAIAWYCTTPWRLGADLALQDFQKVDIETEDGVQIAGRFFGTGDRPVVIMAHDFHQTSAEFKDIARLLGQRSLDIFLFDFRGHGTSGSGSVGWGSTEVADVEAVLKRIQQDRRGKRTSIAWIGVGTGAAAFLNAPSADTVDCAILVNCFDDLEAQFDQGLRAKLHVGLRPLCSLAIAAAEWRTGEKLDTLKPIDSIGRLRRLPMLFVHDEASRDVGERLFQAAGDEAEIYIHPVADAGWRKMSRDGAVTNAISDFLKRWL